MKTPQASSELLRKTIELIANRPRTVTYAILAEETGLPLQFIQDLMGNRLKDPGVQRIELLYTYFSKQKLVFAA